MTRRLQTIALASDTSVLWRSEVYVFVLSSQLNLPTKPSLLGVQREEAVSNVLIGVSSDFSTVST
jgi:hypothetical protein